MHIFIILLSCNPSWFGLDEEIGIYSYHDGLAFAWESFEDDYDLAINYITSSITELKMNLILILHIQRWVGYIYLNQIHLLELKIKIPYYFTEKAQWSNLIM